MRVEKIAKNKIRIFVSYEDLASRGIERDEMFQNGKKVQELFWDMMEVAYAEVGFEMIGPIAVEAFTMPSEGVVIIVTQVPSLPVPGSLSELTDEPEPERDPCDSFVFSFADFEDVVRVGKALAQIEELDCRLYVYRKTYHVFFADDSLSEPVYDAVWSILHEYGELVNVTRAMLDEYGKLISEHALEMLRTFFEK